MNFPTQTAVSNKFPKGFKGQTTAPRPETEAGVNDEASAELAFGRMVAQSAEGKFKVLAANTDKLAGVVVFNNLFDRDQQIGTTGVKPDAYCSVGRKWRGWVEIDETVAVGDAVRVRVTSTGGTPGVFRKTSSAGNTKDLSALASWRTGGTNTEAVAELELDLVSAGSATND